MKTALSNGCLKISNYVWTKLNYMQKNGKINCDKNLNSFKFNLRLLIVPYL